MGRNGSGTVVGTEIKDKEEGEEKKKEIVKGLSVYTSTRQILYT